MNKVLVMVAFVCCANLGNAQTFDEWFRQKETQIKYLIEQIAALKSYEQVTAKGYQIAHKGLTAIFNSKDQDYKQQSDYFLSLGKVKVSIRTYNKVTSVYQMKTEIERQYRLIASSATSVLNEMEKRYINAVYVKLLDDCNDLATEIEMILIDDCFLLKDDERIQRIDKIHRQMQDRYQFSRSFANQLRALTVNRLKETNDISELASTYGIK